MNTDCSTDAATPTLNASSNFATDADTATSVTVALEIFDIIFALVSTSNIDILDDSFILNSSSRIDKRRLWRALQYAFLTNALLFVTSHISSASNAVLGEDHWSIIQLPHGVLQKSFNDLANMPKGYLIIATRPTGT